MTVFLVAGECERDSHLEGQGCRAVDDGAQPTVPLLQSRSPAHGVQLLTDRVGLLFSVKPLWNFLTDTPQGVSSR